MVHDVSVQVCGLRVSPKLRSRRAGEMFISPAPGAGRLRDQVEHVSLPRGRHSPESPSGVLRACLKYQRPKSYTFHQSSSLHPDAAAELPTYVLTSLIFVVEALDCDLSSFFPSCCGSTTEQLPQASHIHGSSTLHFHLSSFSASW